MLKKVMTRAWEIARRAAVQFGGKAKQYISESMKIAWAEVKKTIMIVKEQVIETMKDLVEMATDVYEYEIVTKEWNNYGKSRCYLSIIETREGSRHCVKYDCGYVDNQTDRYVAGKIDLNKRLTLSGARY